ncbi:hypothetical protein GCM10010168_24810 [Actinoplanes ianthinogenes]|uniref:Hemolysin type calcium-binding protein n=1 Tax=Actinoplanes ianthinogenes TaxID=122358 RepID=A0ABM7M924_9ACTN|nr:hypothetical protein [Actinoplanes ianthinogenes]BCJ48121.1 hypothetical protein Aiant_87780 [Actinoplanes ianthinogenes]GGR06569.1 hypothetical protein GCM10010168_24810 [Actinoplanes ianthinogenes]
MLDKKRLLGGAAALGTIPALLTATPAHAATPGCYGDCQPGVVRGTGVIKYDTLPGYNDQVTVAITTGSVTVTNPAAPLTTGAGCTLITTHQARCGAATSTFRLSIRTLDGDDTITNATAIPSLIRAGDGNDHLTGGTADDELNGGLGADLIQGSTGTDTATYNENSTRLGIHADLDGATGDDGSTDDGPAGARDTIAADVENLTGTFHDDVLIGNTGPNVIHGTFGRDVVQGLGGADDLTATGNGTIDGGADTDHCTSDVRSTGTTPDTFVNCELTQVITP